MHFTKWQACGNDFVFVNAMTMDIRPVVKKCVSICNRNFGIGADGIIFVLPSEKATLQMRIFNSDGSEAEMCGNGIRAFAKWAHELGLVSKHHFSVETGAGILFPELLPDGKVRVDMGVPHLNSSEIPVTGFGDGMVVNRKLTNDLHTYRITCVSMGNPHCVIFTDDIDRISLEEIGSRLEADAHFPRKTNVEFAQLLVQELLAVDAHAGHAHDLRQELERSLFRLGLLPCGNSSRLAVVGTGVHHVGHRAPPRLTTRGQRASGPTLASDAHSAQASRGRG